MPEPKSDIGKLFNNAVEEPGEIAYVNGNLPLWLKGSYLRTGPGKFDLDKKFTVTHCFDGYAILTKFDINGSTVKLQKKFLESEAFKRASKVKLPMVCEFATRAFPDPSKSFFSRLLPAIIPELTDNSNSMLFNIGNKTFACGETCYFHDIDRVTLQNGDRHDAQKLYGCQLLSSHPLADKDGTVYNIGISFLTGLKYNIIKIPPGTGTETSKELLKKSNVLATVPCSNLTSLSYIHSFGMTENYIVYIEQPFVLVVSRVLAAAFTKADCQKDWMEWRPDQKNVFVIVNKHTGKVFKTEFVSEKPFFFFHIVNCYEESDNIVIDVPTYNNPEFLMSLTVERLRAGDNDIGDLSRATRFVLPLVDLANTPENVDLVGVKSTATAIRKGNQIIVTPEIYAEPGLEFPTMNRNYLTKKFNYYYASATASKGPFENAIGKVSVRDKNVKVYKEGDTIIFGEPLFVPRPEGTGEDDGCVLVAANDTRDNQKDYLLVLDAMTMTELARVQFKSKLPFALHGLFVFSD